MAIDRYLVLGNPIAHSQSPRIHSLFAQQTGQAMEYDRLLVEEGKFEQTVRELQRQGLHGANVTVPFKEDAFRMADSLSERAAKAGAVNTLIFKDDGGIHGDNTDGAGMVRDITVNHQGEIEGKRVLILGAGGAVRGVLKPLLDERPQSVTIANRTRSKAEELKSLFDNDIPVQAVGFDELQGKSFDLVINGTSLGLQGKVVDLPDSILADGAMAYDMMYGPGSQPFQERLTTMGAVKVMDGLGMLVEQAAESFYLWRGVRPETVEVIKVLRN